MNPLSAARVLDVEPGATFEEVKLAYRKLALELHPDKKGTRNGADDGRRFQQVNEAYIELKRQHESIGTVTRRDKAASDTRSRPSGGRPRHERPEKPPEQDWSKYTSEFEDENPDFWREYERKFWEEYDKTINADGRGGEYEKAREPKVQPNLFVDVDPSLCIACQSCETIAPNVFRIDRNSNLNPKSKVINMKGAGLNKIMNAAETCPTKAILVEDTDMKKRLYPL